MADFLLTAMLTCCCLEVGDCCVLAGLFVVDLRLVAVTLATAATAAHLCSLHENNLP